MDWPGLAWPAHGNAVKETEIEVLLPLPHTHSLILILIGCGLWNGCQT